MAEVQARSQGPSSRGRGGGRGGRGGFSARSAPNRRTNGDKITIADATPDDDGDVSQLRKQYGEKLDTIKELFPNWSDADILYALKETDGDVEVTATRIADGSISQWGEVSKQKKTTTRPKTKDSTSVGLAESSGNSRPVRGGRPDGARGARARGNERGRGASRGRATSHPATNGQRPKETQQLSVPTEESSGWGTITNEDATGNDGGAAWALPDSNAESTATTSTPAATTTESAPTKPSVIPQGTQKTWASIIRQSTAPKPVQKPKEAPAPKPAEVLETPPVEPTPPEPEPEPQPAVEETPKEVAEPAPPAETTPKVVEPEVALPPPEDDLTRVNLEQLPDESNPPTTATAASTAADSWDPRHPQSSAVTPLSASQAQHSSARPAASGFAATALKATERPATRTPSYQKRILEQEEAVIMPGNREVDHAAIQFGAFNLNGAEDDIDGDREDPETRTQPPPESPVAVPRAALPPVSQPAAVPEAFPPSQKPAASLPPAPASAGTVPVQPLDMNQRADYQLATPVAPPTGPAAATAPPPQAPSNNQQFGRYGQASAQEPAGFPQKPYDTFGQQTATTSAGLDSFPAPTTQAAGPQTSAAFSSAPSEYSSYYTADPQQSRGSYNNYYGQQYGQQHGNQSHHEGSNAPNRGFGGYDAGRNENLSQYPQSSAQTRYGAAASEAHNSGHNTPNPIGQGGQQASGQANQPQSNLHQQPHANQYPYSHPYYSSPYYAQYMSQYGGGYGQGGYGGGPYGGKAGVYHQQYGMSPQGPYDHNSSPATSGFGQSSISGRDSGVGSSIDNYGRAGSAQSGAPGLGGSGFGGMHDTFGRGSGYPSQAGQPFNAPNAPASNANSAHDDQLKPYGDVPKAAGGPSPSLAAAARPGSATNTTPAGSGLPPQQSAQQGMGGYGGYPNHLNHGLHGNQSAGSGYGLGGQGSQGHSNGPYGGGYGGNQGFGNFYGGRQQQGGWGGNYH